MLLCASVVSAANDSLLLPRSLYHWLPRNWPDNLVYTSSLHWGDACFDLYHKYQEYSTLEECTQVKVRLYS